MQYNLKGNINNKFFAMTKMRHTLYLQNLDDDANEKYVNYVLAIDRHLMQVMCRLSPM